MCCLLVSFVRPPPTATPNLDFIPIAETVTLTEGQSQGDSVCTEILIIRDDILESKETFEVLLLPHPDYALTAVVQPSKRMAIVTISDREDDDDSTYAYITYTGLLSRIASDHTHTTHIFTHAHMHVNT